MSFPAILALEDGSIFYGEGFGEEKIDVGELVFNTSMTGYQEIITDPSYKKQIITFSAFFQLNDLQIIFWPGFNTNDSIFFFV